MGSGVAWTAAAHVTPKVNLFMHTIFQSLLLQSFVCPKYHFFLWPDMNTEMGVVIYMYLKHYPGYIDSEYI